MKIILKNKFILLSCLMHMSLLLLFIQYTYKKHDPIHIKNTVIFPTYLLIQQDKTIHAINRNFHSTNKKFSPQKNIFASKLINSVSAKTTTHSLLLKILHTAIAEKQIYPENALYLKQAGTVDVAFYLDPNGNVSSITLIKSSGYSSLDNAAVLAVQAASPIKNVNSYLHKPEYFTISIIFQDESLA